MYGAPYGYQPAYYPQNNALPDNLTQLRNQQAQYHQPAVPAAQSGNGLIWVQGESGAKSYLVAPNTTVLLMDSEDTVFYLKSSDASGMPLPLRKFRYNELQQNTPTIAPATLQANETSDGDKYVTHDELRAILADMAKQKEPETEVTE